MLRVSGREVVHSEQFLLPSGEEAVLEFSAPGGGVKFRVRFLEESATEQVSIEVAPDPDDPERGLLTFTNWNKTPRVNSRKPIAVMESDTDDLYLLASASFSGGTYHAFLQFMTEEKK